MITPILESDRLILRPFREQDVFSAFECWESDPEVAKYMFWTSHDDIEKTREWVRSEIEKIDNERWYRFAVALKETQELIGTALVYYEDEVDCWEIGYNIGRKFWGRGYATEAMKAVLDFSVNVLGISQFVGRYAKENTASENVMKKLGFIYEKDIAYYCNDGAFRREGIQCRLAIKCSNGLE